VMKLKDLIVCITIINLHVTLFLFKKLKLMKLKDLIMSELRSSTGHSITFFTYLNKTYSYEKKICFKIN